jgi:hypothetical protein
MDGPDVTTLTPSPDTANVIRPAATIRSAGWVLRRVAVGLAFLLGFALGGAWLLDASIDASADDVQTTQSN